MTKCDRYRRTQQRPPVCICVPSGEASPLLQLGVCLHQTQLRWGKNLLFSQVWICGLEKKKNTTKKVGTLELEGGERWTDGGETGRGPDHKEWKNGKTRCDFLTEWALRRRKTCYKPRLDFKPRIAFMVTRNVFLVAWTCQDEPQKIHFLWSYLKILEDTENFKTIYYIHDCNEKLIKRTSPAHLRATTKKKKSLIIKWNKMFH